MAATSPTPNAPPGPGAGGCWPAVSVIMPVVDEQSYLADAVTRILGQDYPGRLEVVLAVGPSRDQTGQIAAELAAADERVRVVANPTGATPAGLNVALAAARYDVVARVDGHGLLSPGYLRRAVELLEGTGAANVGGVMAAEGRTSFEQAVARAMTSRLGIGDARFHVGGAAGPADTVYLGVFRRPVLDELGGYDEAYRRAQDWELNYRIRRAGHTVWFSPELRVTYRPRSTFRALTRQFFDMGRWRRMVARTRAGSVSLRYLAPPAMVVGCAAGLAVGTVGLAAGVPALLVGFCAPAGYVALVGVGSLAVGRGLPPAARALLPAVVVTMHGAWGVGFLTSPRRLGAAAPARIGGTPGGSAGSADGQRRAAEVL